MKGIRTSEVLSPAASILSALGMLTCCLPWGIGAAFGSLGLSAFFARFQIWFLILSVAFLFFGLFQLLRRSSCGRMSRIGIVLWSVAAVVVMAVVLFPQWVAGVMVGHLP
jgi:hypothetical protein